MLRFGANGLVGIIFSIIGLVSLAIGLVLGRGQLELRERGVRVPGVVVAVDKNCRKGCSYRPVVEFTAEGSQYRITGEVGNSSPTHEVGERVDVLYPRGQPKEAQIDSWLESWFGTTFGLGFFAIFGGMGLPMLFLSLRRRSDAEWARQFGMTVQTSFTEVMRDTRVKVNGRSPYRVVTQWQNPRDGKVYRFESDAMWMEPSKQLQGRGQIAVKLDPDKPRRYWMDVSFLPQAGN
jgi:hypothetical protein